MVRHRPRYARGLTPTDSRREQSHASSKKRHRTANPTESDFLQKIGVNAPQIRQTPHNRERTRTNTTGHYNTQKTGQTRRPPHSITRELRRQCFSTRLLTYPWKVNSRFSLLARRQWEKRTFYEESQWRDRARIVEKCATAHRPTGLPFEEKRRNKKHSGKSPFQRTKQSQIRISPKSTFFFAIFLRFIFLSYRPPDARFHNNGNL